MTGRVIVVGSVNVDLVASADRLPRPGETLTGATFADHDGGKGANQAVASARLGAPTAFVGAVGRDAFAMRARAALEREGIDLAGLRSVEGATGVALIIVDAQGENMISVASEANAALDPADVTAAFEQLAPGPGDVILVGHEIPTLAAKHALRSGRAAGSTTIFNPAPATGVDRSVLAFADILTVNELELATILATEAAVANLAPAPGGPSPADAAGQLLETAGGEPGVRLAVIVTRGARGAMLLSARAPVEIPARHVEAIDAVGAGDTFAGALAAGIALGLPLEDAVRRAVLAASLSTTKPGARGGMPTAADLEMASRTGG
jgi:ribokinase